jgi:glycosyltransferase involved in cell wall biosynthesis
LYSPTIADNGQWQAGLALPLPGDKTQKLCFPNPLDMSRLFQEFQPDIVVIATPGVYGVIGSWFARRHRIPYLTGMHTSFEQLTALYWPHSLQGKIVKYYFRLSNGTLFHHTEAVLGNAEPILAQAESMGAPSTRLIGTPLSTEFILPTTTTHNGSLSSCLFAGRLAKEKNLDALLTAVADFPDIRFSIAGDGPFREPIEQAQAHHPNLKYLGWLDRRELRQQVDAHDALLLPSHFETFGTIALEAMAREKLVFVSSGCGITHWARLLPGLIVIDAAGLSHSLDKIRNKSPQTLKELASTAKAIALAWNNDVMNRWRHIIRETIAEYADKQQ